MDYADPRLPPRQQTIAQLRTLSRKLVREWGFMRNTIAGSELAPSAVHAIIEIGLAPGIQARELGDILCLDKSNTSRQVARLEALGLVRREAVAGDGRAFGLFLTDPGQARHRQIDKFASDQVSAALSRLLPHDQQAVVQALSLYAQALAQDNPNMVSPAPVSDIAARLHQGYLPGCIGDIASLHGRYYAQAAGFGVFFEHKVGSELGAFAQSLPAPGRQMWLYAEGGRTLASIVMDGDLDTGHAHLRWFIVDDSLRGSGIGRALLASAMAFADAHFTQTWLWTFQGLDAARHLYESCGFTLAEQAEGEQWGSRVVEQRFVRASTPA